MPSLVEIGPMFLEMENVFSLFGNYLPLRERCDHVNVLITGGSYLRGYAFLVQSTGTKFRGIAIPIDVSILIHKDR